MIAPSNVKKKKSICFSMFLWKICDAGGTKSCRRRCEFSLWFFDESPSFIFVLWDQILLEEYNS